MEKLFWLVVVLAVLGMCDAGDMVDDSSYDSCVSSEIERYASDPFWEYEGNEDTYGAIAEGACE